MALSISSSDFFGGQAGQPIAATVPSSPTPAPTQPGFVSRVATDIQKRGANLATEISTPHDTVAGNIAGGFKAAAQAAGGVGDVVGEALKTIPGVGAVADAAGNVVKQGFSKVVNYASPVGEQLLKLEQTHPEAAKLITHFLETAAAAGDISGNILAAEGTKAALQTGVDAAGTVAGAASSAVAPALAVTGSGLKTLGEKSTGLGVSMEVPTRQALQSYQATQPTLFERVKGILGGAQPEASTATKPITEANTAVRLVQPGTEWQLGVHAKRVSGQLWTDTILPALKASTNVNNMKEFIGTIRDRIVKSTADLDRRKTLLNALDSFAADYKNVSTFSDEKLQAYKEGWAKFLPDKSYQGQPIAAASKEVRSLAADEARSRLYKVLPDGAAKQAYLDYGNLQSIAEAGIKSVDALRSKGITKQVWEGIMDYAVTPVATAAGKVLYKTGNGLEFLGDRGAKKVRDIIQPR